MAMKKWICSPHMEWHRKHLLISNTQYNKLFVTKHQSHTTHCIHVGKKKEKSV